MLFKPDYNQNAEKILCKIDGINSDMLMDIYTKKLSNGDFSELYEDKKECAVLLLSGKVRFKAEDKIDEICERKNPFEKKPFAIHFSRNTRVKIEALENSEIIIQKTDNERTWEPVFYSPDNCLYQEFGKGQWGGAGHRIVSTVFDLDNAPYSNMVMGEVFNQPGKWSSYPPHHHPQPEVYYYCFDHPHGFGVGFEGDTPYKTENGSCLCIRGGNAHQQVTAPGYEMYYVWMIRHLENNPWDKTRIYEKEHEWLANAD